LLNFAIIGCGRVSPKHISSLKSIQGARLVAVCDLDKEKAQKAVADLNEVAVYDNYKEMLEREDIHVVNILTESGTHADIAVEVANSHRHVVVEKPMALTLEDADRMIASCDRNGVKLFVVKQNRYNLPVLKLREALESGRFGKLVMGTVRVRWCRPQSYYDLDPWRGTWAMDGGVFTNQASHHIDLLEWMMGDVETVFAKAETMLVNTETEDTGVAVLKFTNGALGVVEATTATRPKDLEGSITVMGERGSVEIGGFAVNEMKVWNFVDECEGDREVLEKYKNNPPDVYGFGHVEYLRGVVDCIVNNGKALVDGLEGRRSLELINAIYESAELGKEVRMRFMPKRCRLGHA
jgi:predicted dehydrogenase